MNETTLSVDGMTCKSCARHVTEALRAVAGVTSATVELAERRANIVHLSTTSVAELVAALRTAGYPSREMSPDAQRTSP